MQVGVFGATGGTGRELVKQALGHGHAVRAFVRNPDRLKVIHHRLEVITGDVRDTKRVAAAVAGQDAVLCALGLFSRKPTTVLSDGVRAIVGGMKDAGVRRLLFVSSLGVGDTRGQFGVLFNRIVLPLVLKEVFADKETAETVVRESDLDWTLVQPGRLTNARLTGQYRFGPDAAKGRWFPKIGRADVADFMLAAMERKLFIREAPVIVY
jgi:putative NADH-flavin reductase